MLVPVVEPLVRQAVRPVLAVPFESFVPLVRRMSRVVSRLRYLGERASAGRVHLP